MSRVTDQLTLDGSTYGSTYGSLEAPQVVVYCVGK